MKKTLFSLIVFFVNIFVVYPGTSVRITELNWNPSPEISNGDTIEGDDLEFVEIKNTGSEPFSLSGCAILVAVTYSFTDNTILAPGQFFVVARNAGCFTKKYGFAPQGEYKGKLSNKGEQIVIVSSRMDTLVDVTYNNSIKWPQLSDGAGFTMVSVNDTADQNDAGSWRNSSVRGGSPGADDGTVTFMPVFINEILANSQAPNVDAIELHNPNNTTVDISGWFLTDKVSSTDKFRIPGGTILPAHGYATFYENTFDNATPVYGTSNFGSHFGLSSNGDKVFLLSARNDTLTGYIDAHEFGASDEGVTLGRHTTSNDKMFFVAQRANTLGGENSEPSTGSIIIDEILYNPIGGCEYIKLMNTSNTLVLLYDTLKNGWEVSGLGFNSDSLVDISLAPGASLYLIKDSVSKKEFRSLKGLPDSVAILSFSGALDNSGEKIEVSKPGVPYYDDEDKVKVSYVPVDIVEYEPANPWPTSAYRQGKYLKRVSAQVFGSEPTNWVALGDALPVANAGRDALAHVNSTTTLDGSGSYDIDSLALSYSWSVSSRPAGSGLVLDNASTSRPSFTPDVEGEYTFSLVVQNGYFTSLSDNVVIRVESLPSNARYTEGSFKIYPSVTDNIVRITSQIPYDMVEITSLDGKKTQVTGDFSTISMNTTANIPGVYIVSIYNNDKLLYSTRIVKK